MSAPGLRLAFITQELNAHSTNMGVAHLWAAELARRVTDLHVIASSIGVVDLPANVHVHTLRRESGAGRTERWARLLGHCHTLIGGGRVDGVLAHMVPAYALAAAPWTRVRRLPLVLWYTSHGQSRTLRLAAQLVTAAATGSPESFPGRGDRAFVIGHGVDTTRFAPDESGPVPHRPPVIGTAGRMTRLKGFDVIIRAIGRLDDQLDVRPVVRIAGEPFYPSDYAHAAELQALVASLGLDERVEFMGGVAAPDMPDFYRSLDVFVNWRTVPALDKTGLESLASGTPLITNNRAYADVLGPFAGDFLVSSTVDALATALRSALTMNAGLRAGAVDRLRQITVERHGAAGWAHRMIELFEALRAGRTPSFPTAAGLVEA